MAHRDFDELTRWNGFVRAILTTTTTGADTISTVCLGTAAIATTFDGVDSHVETSGDLPQGIAVQSVIKARSAD